MKSKNQAKNAGQNPEKQPQKQSPQQPVNRDKSHLFYAAIILSGVISFGLGTWTAYRIQTTQQISAYK